MERPLGTFSAKISIAYRLGLIDKDFEYALQVVRKIRNSFAHSIENETLSKSSHHDRLFEVTKILKEYEVFESIVTSMSRVKSSISKDLATFCSVLTVLIIGLSVAAHVSEPVKPTHTFKLRWALRRFRIISYSTRRDQCVCSIGVTFDLYTSKPLS